MTQAARHQREERHDIFGNADVTPAIGQRPKRGRTQPIRRIGDFIARMTIEGETDGLSLGNLCLPDPRLVKRADMYRIDRSLDALEPVAGRNRATHPDVLARKIEERHRRLRGRGSLAQPDPKERSEEHTSELQSLMRISYAVFCLKKKKKH